MPRTQFVFSWRRIAAMLLAVASLAHASQAAVLLSDDFSGPSLDAAQWRAILPFSVSTVTAANSGSLTIMGGGSVVSANQLPTACIISGTFTPVHVLEHFDVVLRSDLTLLAGDAGSRYATRTGIHVVFSVDGSEVSIQYMPQSGDWRLLADARYHLYPGKAYTYSITDTGTNVSLAINGQNVISADTTFRPGGYLLLSCREFPYTGSRLDNLLVTTIPQPTVVTVPDTSGRLVNMSTLGTGGFTMGFVVDGSTPRKVLVRAVGPGLKNFGVASPATRVTITLYSGGQVVAVNTGWSTGPATAEIAGVVGPFPLVPGSADSALLLSLSPGSYSAQVGADGPVLVEAYEVR